MSDIPANPAAPTNDPSIKNRYGELCAEVYVLDKPPGALDDIGYYTAELGALSGPVLEAGCGAGRLLIPLLEAGVPIEGFDRSAAMLAQARQACDARGLNATLRRMSFHDFAYPAPFAAIVSPVGTFTLIDDYAEALAALRRFREHLAPGGRLYVDLMPLGYLTSAAHDSVRTWMTPAGDLLRLETRRVEVDLLGQRLVCHTRYERWRGGRLVESELEELATRAWGLHEFELTLKEAGFTDVSVCGGYRPGRPPRATDRWWCFRAVRG
ncbi:MAG TPA: class I SAM-dependent methyltransferase [Caulobacteraceae bacterium]|jgi:SAM-dependent methyltransferase